jgi:lysophospholipase L1-like esterase
MPRWKLIIPACLPIPPVKLILRGVLGVLATLALLIGSSVGPVFAGQPDATATRPEVPFPDPRRLEPDIAAFAAQDAADPPPAGAIVAVGSSSLRMWQGTIRKDLAPLSIIPRGFGGSTMHDAEFYADCIVIPYRPRAVLLYEGDNDIDFGVSPPQVLEAFEAFVKKVQAALPGTRIYVISIKPSPARWASWPEMKDANGLLQTACAGDSLLEYIDVATGMLAENGQPIEGIFLPDKLHLNEKGYAIWREAILPVLVRGELAFEPARSAPGPGGDRDH